MSVKIEYTISEFARLTGVSRQNISVLAKKGEMVVRNENGKIDITDKINHDYILSQQEKHEDDITPIPEKKTPTKKLKIITSTGSKTKNTYDAPPENDEPENENSSLREKARNAKFRKEIAQADKAEMDLKKSRAQLAELDTIGEVCIGYLIALNQELFDIPRSIIDEVTAGIKTGKSKTELTDILRKPSMKAVADSMDFVKKEIARYKRDVKSDNK